MQSIIQHNTFFIAALVISGAILLIPLLLRIGKKSAMTFGNSLLRREPAVSNAAKDTTATTKPSVGSTYPINAAVHVAHGQQPPLKTFVSLMDEGLEKHYADWIKPLVEASEGTAFVLRSVTIELTAQNLPLTQFLADLQPGVIKRLFLDCLRRSSGSAYYETSQFYGVAFAKGAEAVPADSEVIRVLRVHGAERMEVAMIFRGDAAYSAPRQTQLRSLSAISGDAGKAASTQIATLEVSIPGVAPRTVPVTHTPFRVGADPRADLTIDLPFISRTHIVLERCTNGGVSITDEKSANGTWLNGMRLTLGVPVRLNTRSLILLAGATPGDVPLIEYREHQAADSTKPADDALSLTKPDAATTQTLLQPASNAKSERNALTNANEVTSRGLETQYGSATATLIAPTTGLPPAAKPVARLLMITPDGAQTEYPLNELGIEIGRDPTGDKGIVVPAHARYVSRHHLKLAGWAYGNGVLVDNLALRSGGTYLDDQRQDAQFIWRFADPQRPDEGWLTLGDPALGGRDLRLRLMRDTATA